MLARLALAGYVAALLTATHWPRLNVNPESGFRLDLFIHCGAFGLLALLMTGARLFDRQVLTPRNVLTSALASSAIAGFDEITQAIAIFQRVADPLDYAANLVGIALASCFLLLLRRLLGPSARPTDKEVS